MGSPVLKRSVVIGGHKTSVSLEDEFWSGLKEIAAGRNMTLSDLVATVERGRESGNLSSSLRLFVLESYRQRAAGRVGEGQNGAGAPTAAQAITARTTATGTGIPDAHSEPVRNAPSATTEATDRSIPPVSTTRP